MIDDGKHRSSVLAKALGVSVTPLQPPFDGAVMFFEFASGEKLAVSKSDGEKIRELYGGKPEGRNLVLAADENDRSKIYVHLSH